MAVLDSTALAALADADPDAFTEALAEHPWFESMLVPLVTRLQAQAQLAAALRARLPEYRARSFDRWMARRVLPLRRLDRPEFCRLATELAREHEPEFPALEPEPLPLVDHWWCGGRRRRDDRSDGRGWTFEIEERDVGPAEVIHEEDWQAVAQGHGWTLTLRLSSSSDDVRVWAEPA